jgi:hypothetical protein
VITQPAEDEIERGPHVDYRDMRTSFGQLNRFAGKGFVCLKLLSTMLDWCEPLDSVETDCMLEWPYPIKPNQLSYQDDRCGRHAQAATVPDHGTTPGQRPA